MLVKYCLLKIKNRIDKLMELLGIQDEDADEGDALLRQFENINLNQFK